MVASTWPWTPRPVSGSASRSNHCCSIPCRVASFVLGKFLAVLVFTTLATFLATAFFLVLAGHSGRSELHRHSSQPGFGHHPAGRPDHGTGHHHGRRAGDDDSHLTPDRLRKPRPIRSWWHLPVSCRRCSCRCCPFNRRTGCIQSRPWPNCTSSTTSHAASR